jgi:5-formyltetrahydrofolate cyclo-ligase
LQELRAKRHTIAIGFAYAQQELAQVPIDAFDQRLDGVITQDGVRIFT